MDKVNTGIAHWKHNNLSVLEGKKNTNHKQKIIASKGL